jgi:3-oxoacyl-[acyl-carrier-protein] synthase I
MIASTNKNLSVNVVGVGATTAVGRTALSSAAAVRGGIAAFTEHPYMIDQEGEPMIVARASYLSEEVDGVERFVELALPAAQEALAPLSKLPGNLPSIPIVVGLPSPRPGLRSDFEKQLVNRLQDRIDRICSAAEIETIAAGHSAGLMALEVASRKIQNGSFEFCLVGGIDSYLEPETLEWLEENQQLHKTTNAWGFIPGEAAGFCLLCSAPALEQFELATLSSTLAVATNREENLINTESICVGRGLSEAVRQVLQLLPSPSTKIDQTICDMNGETYRADEYAFTIARTSDHFVDATDFVTPADCWGDVGAASGPLFVNLTVAAGCRGYSKGPHVLVWTSSECGERSAALLRVDGNAHARQP